jgi:hypothetical protein
MIEVNGRRKHVVPTPHTLLIRSSYHSIASQVVLQQKQMTYSFLLSFFPTLILLSGVGITCFHHVVINIRQLFLRPA